MCLSPYLVNRDRKDQALVPCGKCLQCRKRRASAWSFRLMQECKHSLSAYFITLTYETDYVPISTNGFMSLDRLAIPLFFKRLRKYQSGSGVSGIKYYAVGEYGGRFGRPHYHAIVFNVQCELIEKAWTFGSIHVGTVTEASVGYCMKYISKEKWVKKHERDDRVAPFGFMSKGLGLEYLTSKMMRWHKCDLLNRMYCVVEDGKKISMPRYYKNRIYSEAERVLVADEYRRKYWDEERVRVINESADEWKRRKNHVKNVAKIVAGRQRRDQSDYSKQVKNLMNEQV